MEYFAGLFDAEGWVSLLKSGHFIIGIEVTHEPIIDLLLETFGGKKYSAKRSGKKPTHKWVIATNRETALSFIAQIKPLTRIKRDQLDELNKYLNQTREKRKATRDKFIKRIAELKQPTITTFTGYTIQTIIKPTKPFFKWLAGFIDGDGNFTVYEYQNGKRRTFDSWIGAFNIHPEAIIHINDRVNGSISKYKGAKFPVWKWVCSQKESQFVCDSLYPYLIIKKEQCRLVSEYLKIHTAKIKGVDHSEEIVTVIRDIIKQIKHQNSL